MSIGWFQSLICQAPSSLPDYLNNIWGNWSANRGVIINAAMDQMIRWDDYTQGIVSGVNGAPAISSGGVIALDGSNDAFSIPFANNPDLIGPVTFCFLVQKTTARDNVNAFFDSNNAPSPRAIMYMERSTAIDKMSLYFNGVRYDADVSFPYDANYHTVAFRIDGGASIANIWLDGVQVSSNFSITGGAISWTTNTSWFFRSVLEGSFGVFNIRRMRIYNEYISNANMSILMSGPFSSALIDNTPVNAVLPCGQSNVGPAEATNIRSNYDLDLRTDLGDVEYFDYVSNNNKFIPIPDNVDVFTTGSFVIRCGPFLKVARDLMTKYPANEWRILEFYESATNLNTDWKASPPGTTYTRWLDRMPLAVRTLIAEQRNITSLDILWIQGESDADNEAFSLAYYANLTAFAADMRSRLQTILAIGGISINIKFIVSALSNRSSSVYQLNVRNAQESFVSDDPNNFLIDTDNATDFPYVSGAVHYSVTGLTNIGRECVELI